MVIKELEEKVKGLPLKVRFTGSTKEILYAEGFKKGKVYPVIWDDIFTYDIFKEAKTVTVTDDDGHGHEICFGDYEVLEVYK